jgi:hypothetical protein
MGEAPSRPELEAAHCWESDDRVPGRPAMTEFRRRLRYHQARWREANGHPIGTQPIAPRSGGKPARRVGSRLPLDYARETGGQLPDRGRADGGQGPDRQHRGAPELRHQRLWADLLWSPTLAFNLFGDPAAGPDLADRAVRRWWPDAPGRLREVRFAHSPGRFDPSYLNSLRAFDAALVLDLDDGIQGVVAVDTNYHERSKPETPKPRNLRRNLEVAERSGAFAAGATGALTGRSELAVMWLEHLLLLSMLQHPRSQWRWGRYVVVHPAGNTDLAAACARYRSLLADQATFASVTLEELLDAGALPAPTVATLRDRYLPVGGGASA